MIKRKQWASGNWGYQNAWCANQCIEDCLEDGKCEDSPDDTNGGVNKIVNQNGEEVGYCNCCTNPSSVVASAIVDCVASWPQCGDVNSKCRGINGDNKHLVDSRAHCEAEAEAA